MRQTKTVLTCRPEMWLYKTTWIQKCASVLHTVMCLDTVSREESFVPNSLCSTTTTPNIQLDWRTMFRENPAEPSEPWSEHHWVSLDSHEDTGDTERQTAGTIKCAQYLKKLCLNVLKRSCAGLKTKTSQHKLFRASSLWLSSISDTDTVVTVYTHLESLYLVNGEHSW